MPISDRTIQRALEGREWAPVSFIVDALDASCKAFHPYRIFSTNEDIRLYTKDGAKIDIRDSNDRRRREFLLTNALRRLIPGIIGAYGYHASAKRECKLYTRVMNWHDAQKIIAEMPSEYRIFRELKHPRSLDVLQFAIDGKPLALRLGKLDTSGERFTIKDIEIRWRIIGSALALWIEQGRLIPIEGTDRNTWKFDVSTLNEFHRVRGFSRRDMPLF